MVKNKSCPDCETLPTTTTTSRTEKSLRTRLMEKLSTRTHTDGFPSLPRFLPSASPQAQLSTPWIRREPQCLIKSLPREPRTGMNEHSTARLELRR